MHNIHFKITNNVRMRRFPFTAGSGFFYVGAMLGLKSGLRAAKSGLRAAKSDPRAAKSGLRADKSSLRAA